MSILFLFSFLYVTPTTAIDVGDGSDGACVATSFTSTTKRYYQCTSLTIDTALDLFKAGSGSPAVNGGAQLIIKVQGEVVINNTIDLSGAAGVDGDAFLTVKPGGSAGAGGSAGGNAQLAAANGLNGNGAGGGIAGNYVIPVVADSIGGGGGGGSYNTKSAIEPLDGDSIGDGSGSGSAGANGNSFGAEASFETSFAGGSGGGAGGSASDAGPVTGSSGGGGGGALRIIAGGNITLNGIIKSNGGNGGGTGASINSGGGGGGSGGAIWLQAAGDITGTGSIEALGGLKGLNNGFAGYGGEGSLGRIRLDDSNGVAALASVNPLSQGGIIFTPTAIPSSEIARQYASVIACGRVSLEDEKPINNLINLLLGMMIAAALYFSLSRKGKI